MRFSGKGLAAFLLLGVLLGGCLSQEQAAPSVQPTVATPTPSPVYATPSIPSPSLQPSPAPSPAEPSPEIVREFWQYGGIAIPGTYADANIVNVGNGVFRLYYSIEPEVPGNKLELYSATSTDGKTWVTEEGVRKDWATFPDVVKLSDGRFRLYFQNAGVIKSALSTDGLSWEDEQGVRIDASNSLGLVFENVAAPTVVYSDGEYVMVYRGTINQKYPADVPNPNTQLFLYATSKDGLEFVKKGLALDSRNSQFNGLLDGPAWAEWDDGSLRLYFWSYAGIYHVVFENGVFSEAEFDYTTSENAASPAKFPPNPPGDPTLAKIGGVWQLYYGIHTKGIHYATLRP
ncbi:MAG: hypothetical protein V1717_00900 [Candidatus Micrarchaeota archaeon]